MTTIQLDKDRLHSAGLGVFFRPSELDELGITYDQAPAFGHDRRG